MSFVICFSPAEIAMHLELPYVPTYLRQTESVEPMIQIVYAFAGAEFFFSGGAELILYIANVEKVVFAGRQDCLLPVVCLTNCGRIVVGSVKCPLMVFDMIMEFNFALR